MNDTPPELERRVEGVRVAHGEEIRELIEENRKILDRLAGEIDKREGDSDVGPEVSDIRRFAEQIQPIFERMGWEWSTVGGVPSADAIESTLTELLRDLSRGAKEVSSGRLVVRRSWVDHEGGSHEESVFLSVGGWDEFGQVYFPDGSYHSSIPEMTDEERDEWRSWEAQHGGLGG